MGSWTWGSKDEGAAKRCDYEATAYRREEKRARAAGSVAPQVSEVTHRCPIGDAGRTPCCDRSMFELPLTDRVTEQAELITCAGWVIPPNPWNAPVGSPSGEAADVAGCSPSSEEPSPAVRGTQPAEEA